MDKKKKEDSILTYSTIGIQHAATVILFIVGGYKLDEYLKKAPIFTTIGAVVGMVIGFYHLIKQLKDVDGREREERDKERKRWR